MQRVPSGFLGYLRDDTHSVGLMTGALEVCCGTGYKS